MQFLKEIEFRELRQKSKIISFCLLLFRLVKHEHFLKWGSPRGLGEQGNMANFKGDREKKSKRTREPWNSFAHHGNKHCQHCERNLTKTNWKKDAKITFLTFVPTLSLLFKKKNRFCGICGARSLNWGMNSLWVTGYQAKLAGSRGTTHCTRRIQTEYGRSQWSCSLTCYCSNLPQWTRKSCNALVFRSCNRPWKRQEFIQFDFTDERGLWNSRPL